MNYKHKVKRSGKNDRHLKRGRVPKNYIAHCWWIESKIALIDEYFAHRSTPIFITNLLITFVFNWPKRCKFRMWSNLWRILQYWEKNFDVSQQRAYIWNNQLRNIILKLVQIVKLLRLFTRIYQVSWNDYFWL